MLAILLILAVIILIGYKSLKRPHNFFPGPQMMPFIGNLPSIDMTDPNKSLLKLNEEYGDCGLLIYPYIVVVLKSGELIKEMFTGEQFAERPDVCINRDRFGGRNLGIISISGPLLHNNKRFALQTFRNLGMGKQKQETVMTEEANELLDRITEYNGNPFEIEPILSEANVNVTWTILGGRRFDKDDPKFKIFTKAIRNVVHQLSIFGNVSVIFPYLRYIFPKLTKHEYFLRHNGTILSIVKETIREHKSKLDAENPQDFIDSYLCEIQKSTEASDKYKSERQLEAMVCDAVVAGSDTTSTQLAMTFLFISMYQDIQRKAYDEICKEIGATNEITSQEATKLQYCRAVLSETMRMRPPVPIAMPHQASTDTTLGKYNVPKGTVVLAHLEKAFNDKETWGDPENFRPERFINAEGLYQAPDTFLPFSKGKRRCMGEIQAKLSGILMLTKLLQKFQFRLPDGVEKPNTEGKRNFVLSPPAFHLVAIPRSS